MPGVALHFPELGDLDSCGVEFQGSAHRGEKLGFRLASQEDEGCLILQRVDSIDDVVVVFQMEFGSTLLAEDLLQGRDLCRGIDAEQALAQRLHLYLSHGLRCCHQLAIDVGDAHTVGVDNSQMADATANQTLGAPRTYAAHAKDNHMLLGDVFHCLVTQLQL